MNWLLIVLSLRLELKLGFLYQHLLQSEHQHQPQLVLHHLPQLQLLLLLQFMSLILLRLLLSFQLRHHLLYLKERLSSATTQS